MLKDFKQSRQKQFLFLFIIFLILYFFVPKNENSYFWRLPPLLKDIPLMFNALLDNLMFNWFTIQVWDPDWGMYEDKTLFRVITRSLSNSVLFFIIFISSSLKFKVQEPSFFCLKFILFFYTPIRSIIFFKRFVYSFCINVMNKSLCTPISFKLLSIVW